MASDNLQVGAWVNVRDGASVRVRKVDDDSADLEVFFDGAGAHDLLTMLFSREALTEFVELCQAELATHP
ncbi:hypothetical protein [Actinokineospora sp. NBRC 105648]|uniref:hypothetical protein n=1 Tax=Actinokineospora sp. NBRC 105648 TaxID=3032206 RepID=UPI0024A5D77F|nr:hypothetical protein [Actinokineospora sp. NBRC 105648]GLZ41181.1 hypothetical protein Acsp05_48050 [Actinokineospora sp. NBRC 105648]